MSCVKSLVFFRRATLYSDKMNTWYDMKTKEELLNSTIFSLIQKSLDTPGLVGLDKLMSFMIVRELQVGYQLEINFST